MQPGYQVAAQAKCVKAYRYENGVVTSRMCVYSRTLLIIMLTL
jgi:hypothetical protein